MFEADHNFYSRMQSSGNFLLMRSDVGRRKPAIHVLPSADFVYGKSLERDKVRAGEMINDWHSHKTSDKSLQDIYFKLMNSVSVSKVFSTPIEYSKFRKDHKIRIRLKTSQSVKKIEIPDMIHGKPIQPNAPMKAIITNFYANYACQQKHEDYELYIPKKPHKWNSNKSYDLFQKSKEAKVQKPAFKMKKFINTQSKTDCWRPKTTQTTNNS